MIVENEHFLSTQTKFLLLAIVLFYFATILYKAIRARIDIYDLLLLASLGIFVMAFAIFPDAILWITKIVGIQFPFLLLFGGLIFILFIGMFRMLEKITEMESKITTLTQELALWKNREHPTDRRP